MKTKIYTLSHPITKEIRYVGKTKFSLNDRLCKHMLTKEKNHRANWIRKIKKAGLKPIIELIEEVDDYCWKESEIYWIEQLNQWNFRLLNSTKGGDSGIISEKCRKASILSNIGRVHCRKSVELRVKNLEKPVIGNKENIDYEFKSASEAARQINGCLSHITECCNNKPKRKTHKGYKWRYKNALNNM